MSTRIEALREELLANPYIQGVVAPGSHHPASSVAGLGMCNLGIITRAAATVLNNRYDHRTERSATDQARKLGEIVVPVVRHVGALPDREANYLMVQIGGPLFAACLRLHSTWTNVGSNNEGYPRVATKTDEELAEVIDRKIADHAAKFIASTQGAYLLGPVTGKQNPIVGCPLQRARAPGSVITYLDQLAMQAVSEFLDPDSPFVNLGFTGIAKTIVTSLRPAAADTFRLSNPEEYASQMEKYSPAGEWHWQLPNPDLQT